MKKKESMQKAVAPEPSMLAVMEDEEKMEDFSVSDEDTFEQLFKEYFRELHVYSFSVLRDWDLAEEVVQTLFLKLWENGSWKRVETSMKSFLYRSVYHESLNVLRQHKVRRNYENSILYTMKNETEYATSPVELNELEERIRISLNRLPEKCRTVFQLSRFGELKYHEIASQLGISVKTVETQMGKAIRMMRRDLKDYLCQAALND
ncbi:MAG: RNA polymerase sigma-70 factor [Prolixibacteraceae bacterium]